MKGTISRKLDHLRTILLLFSLYFGSTALALACSNQKVNELAQLENSGKSGQTLLLALESMTNVETCGRYNYLVGLGFAQEKKWRNAIKSFKESLTPDSPETYGRLAESAYNHAQTRDGQGIRNRFLSQASTNANLANGLFKEQRKTTPPWLVDLILAIGSSTENADSDYYAQAIANSTQLASGAKSLGYVQSKGGYKGAGVVPGIDVQILFEYNSASLSAEGKRQVSELGGALTQYLSASPAARFSIVGHTDIQGDATYNEKLSRQRAGTVAAALRSLLSNVSIQEFARGESDPKLPVDLTQPMDSRKNQLINQANRRVEVMVSQ